VAVYLLHYDRGLLNGRNRHYLGMTDSKDPSKRITQHRRGTGSAFAREMRRQGIGFQVAAIWPDLMSSDEREIKRQKQSARFCPICRPGRTAVLPSERREAEAVKNASQFSYADGHASMPQTPIASNLRRLPVQGSKEAPVPDRGDLEDLPF
jgi:predicted GIY-YIG superfamily endonuclease